MIDVNLLPYFVSLNDNFVKEIERVWISGDRVLIITKSDQVHGINATPAVPAIATTSANIQIVQMLRASRSARSLNSESLNSEPKQLFELQGKNVKDFIFGGDFIIALTRKGELFSWGGNQTGQLGLGSRPSAPHPTLISTLSDKIVTKVVCGENTAMALCDDGQVLCWGQTWGFVLVKFSKIQDKATDIALASASSAPTSSAQAQTLQYFYFCLVDGKIKSAFTEGACWLNDVKSIVCNENQILALKNNGSLYSATLYVGQPLVEDNFIAVGIIPKITEIYATSTIITNNSRFNMYGAKTESNQIYIWGMFRGQKTSIFPTSYSSFNKAVLMYSHFRMTHGALKMSSLNSNTKDYSEYIKTIFDDQSKNSDFIIVVEQKEIFVHRAILRQNSKYFKDKLAEPGNENDENVLHVKDFPYEVFKLFLQYLYGIDITVTRENVMKLMLIAHQYLDEKFENLIMEKIADDENMRIAIPAMKTVLKMPPEGRSIAMSGFQFMLSKP